MGVQKIGQRPDGLTEAALSGEQRGWTIVAGAEVLLASAAILFDVSIPTLVLLALASTRCWFGGKVLARWVFTGRRTPAG